MYRDDNAVAGLLGLIITAGIGIGSYYSGKKTGVKETTERYEDSRRDHEIALLKAELNQLKGITQQPS